MKWLMMTGVVSVALGLTSLAADEPPGQRVKLTDGSLFIPADLKTRTNDASHLTLHLHGAPEVVEENFMAAKWPGVLVVVTLPGLSAVYTERFKDTNTFWRILREVETQLKTSEPSVPRAGQVAVTSFSAGFGGVRELLRDADIFARINAVVMADSIYAGFAGDPPERKVDPTNMASFLKFAQEAAEGRKRLLISHTQLHTPNYASTVETADYLITQLGGRREVMLEDWPGGLKLTSRFRKGRCEILGFAGDTGVDHMQHLRLLRFFLERLPGQ